MRCPLLLYCLPPPSLPPSALPGTFPECPHLPPRNNLLQLPATTPNKFYATAAPVTAGGGSQVKSIERLKGVRHPKSREGGRGGRGSRGGCARTPRWGFKVRLSVRPSPQLQQLPPPTSTFLPQTRRLISPLRSEYIQAIGKTKCKSSPLSEPASPTPPPFSLGLSPRCSSPSPCFPFVPRRLKRGKRRRWTSRWKSMKSG